MKDPTAIMGRRIGAFLIDSLIAGLVMTIAFLIRGETAPPGSDCESLTAGEIIQLCTGVNRDTLYATGSNAATIFAVTLAASALNSVVLQGLGGASLGKRTFRLRVVGDDGALAGVGRNLSRWLLWLVDGQPVGIPLVGLICALASPGHRRIGDMVAKTYVVDQGAVGKLVAPPKAAAPSFEQPAPSPPTEGDGGGWQPPSASR